MNTLEFLRSFRIFNIALFDLIAGILGLHLIIMYFTPNRPHSFHWAWSVLLVLPLGVVSHYYFGVDTQLNRYLGIYPKQ